MSTWSSTKAKRVYAAPARFRVDLKEAGRLSQEVAKARMAELTFCFHDGEEVGPAPLAKIARDTGLRPDDL